MAFAWVHLHVARSSPCTCQNHARCVAPRKQLSRISDTKRGGLSYSAEEDAGFSAAPAEDVGDSAVPEEPSFSLKYTLAVPLTGISITMAPRASAICMCMRMCVCMCMHVRFYAYYTYMQACVKLDIHNYSRWLQSGKGACIVPVRTSTNLCLHALCT